MPDDTNVPEGVPRAQSKQAKRPPNELGCGQCIGREPNQEKRIEEREAAAKQQPRVQRERKLTDMQQRMVNLDQAISQTQSHQVCRARTIRLLALPSLATENSWSATPIGQ